MKVILLIHILLVVFTIIIRSAGGKLTKLKSVTRMPKKEKVVFVPPEIKPQLLIFNLDRTIWPIIMDELELPYKINRKGVITDDCTNRLTLFPHTFRMLQKLKKLKFKLAVICYAKDFNIVNNLLALFKIHKIFDYKEFSYDSQFNQIDRIQNLTKIPFEDMIYFDINNDEFGDLEYFDILCFRVGEKGVIMTDIQSAWKMYATKKSQPKDPK